MGNSVLKLKPESGDAKKTRQKRALAKYFYRVSNHQELFKIGTSFYNDFKNGVKSFAISSTGYQTSQQKSILGLASFFDHQESLKIAIISDNLFQGSFKELISASIVELIEMDDYDFSYQVHSFYNHFDFIDLNYLVTHVKNNKGIDLDYVLEKLVDSYDVLFWDVPELHKIQKDTGIYFPMIMKFDSLSIIVAQGGASSVDEVNNIRNFFLDYGINLKGLLLDSNQQDNKDNKKDNKKKDEKKDKQNLKKVEDIKDKEKDINDENGQEKKNKKRWWRFFK